MITLATLATPSAQLAQFQACFPALGPLSNSLQIGANCHCFSVGKAKSQRDQLGAKMYQTKTVET